MTSEIERIPPPATRPSDLQSVQPSHSEDDRHQFKKAMKKSLKDKKKDDSEKDRRHDEDDRDVIVEIEATAVEPETDETADEEENHEPTQPDGRIDIKA